MYNVDMATITHEEAKANKQRYKILSNGAVYDYEAGRIVANPGGGTTAITQAKSSELRALWTEKKQRAKLRGLMRANGLDPDEVDEIEGGGVALERLTAHMAKTFLSSTNLRGMAETYNKLALDDQADVNGQSNQNVALLRAVGELVRQLRREDADIVDGKVSDG